LAAPDAARPELGEAPEPELSGSSERSPAPTAHPVAAQTAAIADASEAPELTTAEAQALEVETPPGVIEGIVLRGREPLTTGGFVFFRRGYAEYIREDPRNAAAQDKLDSTSIDLRGTFRIVGLEPGDYTLALDLGNGAEQQTTVRLAPNKPGRRVVIVLGTATVKGHVYDMEGRPVAHARVRVDSEFSRKGANNFADVRSTGVDGSYEITDVPAGPAWFTVLLSGDWASRETDQMQRVTIAAGEVRIIDFGAPEPAKKWTGTVRARTGDEVRGGGTLSLTRTDTRAYSEAKIEDDGTFSVLLRPGQYSVGAKLNSNWDARVSFPPIQVGTLDLNQDLTLAGTSVTGVVIDARTGQPVHSALVLHIGLRLRDTKAEGPSGSVDDKGRFAVAGVEPGVWLVSAWPLQLVEGDHEITVGKQDVEIPLRLTVKTGK
jgi:hypothetical protein